MSLTGEYIPSSEIKGQPFQERRVTIPFAEYIQLKSDAKHWQALHAHTKAKVAELELQCAVLKAQIADLQKQLYGKRSEKNGSGNSEASPTEKTPRKRGQQPGNPAPPRRPLPALPIQTEHSTLSEAERTCPHCGQIHAELPNTEDAEVIEIAVKAYRRTVKRHKYAKRCTCPGMSVILTAPAPIRLFPRNVLGISVWREVLIEKFLHARSLNSLCQDFQNRGLPLAQGTLVDGLKRMSNLFEPVIACFKKKQLSEPLFHNDETTWKQYEAVPDKVGNRWYLWLIRSESVSLFIAASTRSGNIPIAYFNNLDPCLEKVIIVCDRYSGYKRLARLNLRITLAFCWVHVRRDFLKYATGFPNLHDWMINWANKISRLFHLNHLRLAQWDRSLTLNQQSAAFNACQRDLEKAVAAMKDDYEQALSDVDSKKQKIQHQLLSSLKKHWDGLTVFLNNPNVPMENNLAERTIRGAVMGRNNYYGSGAIWSAELAAQLFSIFRTLQQWGINPQHWLNDYLTACAQNDCKPPPDLTEFIPWLMTEARTVELQAPLAAV